MMCVKTVSIFAVVCILLILPFAYGVVSHLGTEVIVTYNSAEITAQAAADALWATAEAARVALATSCSYAAGMSLAIPAASPVGTATSNSHVASQVKVVVGGSLTTMQQFIWTLDAQIAALHTNCQPAPVVPSQPQQQQPAVTTPAVNNFAPTGSASLSATNDLTGTITDADYAGELDYHVYVDNKAIGSFTTVNNNINLPASQLISDTNCHTIQPYAIDKDSKGNTNGGGTLEGGTNVLLGTFQTSGCVVPETPTTPQTDGPQPEGPPWWKLDCDFDAFFCYGQTKLR